LFIVGFFLSWRLAVGQEMAVNNEKTLALSSIVQNILTNDKFAEMREFYGSRDDKKVALVSNPQYGILWPTNFPPRIGVFEVVFVNEWANKDLEKPHLLGIRIDGLKQQEKSDETIAVTANLTIMNAGGRGEKAIIGGADVIYVCIKKDNKWTSKLIKASDD
jgi:hypothetical protein